MSKTFPLLAQEHERVEAKAAAALERLAHVVMGLQWQAAAARGLTALQGFLLAELVAHPRLGVRELAERFRLTRPTVSRALTTLKAKGLVKAEADPNDGRRISFRLTPRGHRAASALAQAPEPLLAAFGSLPPPAAATIWTGLLQLLVLLERAGVMAAGRMCPTCRYFRDQGGGHAFCQLLEKPLRPQAWRLDCPDHQPLPSSPE